MDSITLNEYKITILSDAEPPIGIKIKQIPAIAAIQTQNLITVFDLFEETNAKNTAQQINNTGIE